MSETRFINRILLEPSYGWKNAEGDLSRPGTSRLWKETFSRINIFAGPQNWISFSSVVMMALLAIFPVFFFSMHFSWWLVGVILFYSLCAMGAHGTIWFHRYCTHKAYKFSHPIWRFITQNLVIRTFPEEIYVVSHHVHHSLSDLPGDPYNPEAGLLYCMLAEFNHQRVSKDLSESEYKKVKHFLSNSGVVTNSYEAYKKLGSVMSPFYVVLVWILNWAFWYTALFLIGGHALATAVFTAAFLWFVGIRAFNFTGHGKGKVAHKDGIDFDRSNLSINQTRPGLMTGEWHNNHHLYPGSARAGFLKYQFDIAWVYIFSLYKLGMVKSYKDSKPEFMRKFQAAGHCRDMVPLAGDAYDREQVERVNAVS